MNREILYKNQFKMIPVLSRDFLTYTHLIFSKSGIPDLERDNLSKTVYPDLKRIYIYNLTGGSNGNT